MVKKTGNDPCIGQTLGQTLEQLRPRDRRTAAEQALIDVRVEELSARYANGLDLWDGTSLTGYEADESDRIQGLAAGVPILNFVPAGFRGVHTERRVASYRTRIRKLLSRIEDFELYVAAYFKVPYARVTQTGYLALIDHIGQERYANRCEMECLLRAVDKRCASKSTIFQYAPMKGVIKYDTPNPE